MNKNDNKNLIKKKIARIFVTVKSKYIMHTAYSMMQLFANFQKKALARVFDRQMHKRVFSKGSSKRTFS